ncbi:unnamed protein product [Rotaria sp. Silwood2]|nr:unnamed protein product [Rotaria sp. Silwood2]
MLTTTSKQLIQDYCPQLNKFYFTYYNKINNDNHQYEICSKELNEFCSSFWIERKWILNVEVDGIYIKFIIHPFKKIFFNWLEEINIQFSTSLILVNFLIYSSHKMLINTIKRRLTVTTIYHLVVQDEISSFHTLLPLINSLSNLITIKFHSLPSDE